MSRKVDLLDDKFEPAGQGTLDSRKRIAVTKAVERLPDIFGREVGEIRFTIAFNKAGQILLSPETSIPLHEAWLYKNKTALKSVLKGIGEAKRGKVRKIGSFAKNADDQIE